MSAERIQKLLARAGVASRRASEKLIRDGRVTVNGQVADLGDKADPESDAIKVDGRRLALPLERRYLVLNKPKGYITSKSDPEGRPTVMDLVPYPWRKSLAPVGRLDFNTEGLLLLTSDGDFAQRVAHPSYGCRKLYAVKVKGEPAPAALAQLREGIVIDGKRTQPAKIRRLPKNPARPIANSWWSLEIGEGRTRQIREMFFRVGHPVLKLRRVAIGSLRDDRLPIGEWRDLRKSEIDGLMGKPKAKVGRRRKKR